jgi:hypothetical protein
MNAVRAAERAPPRPHQLKAAIDQVASPNAGLVTLIVGGMEHFKFPSFAPSFICTFLHFHHLSFSSSFIFNRFVSS